MKLVLAEKPSVAQSIAKVLGAAKREDGYLEGNGYVVSWCVGHLVELAQPEAYDAKSIIRILFMVQPLPLFCPAINRLLRSFRDQPNTGHLHSTGDTPSGTQIIYLARRNIPLLACLF